ncbi:MAG: hypothetical protein ACYC8T_06545 [Myxococcaceae bacterium]
MRRACLLSLLVSFAASGQSEGNRLMEVRVNPLVAQLGTLQSEHYGSSLGVLVSPREGIAVGLTGRYFWVSREGFDLSRYDRKEGGYSAAVLSTWAVLASSELTPVRGEFMALGAGPLELELALTAGLGVIGTRQQLKPASQQTGPATYGDTGLRFGGAVGAGLTATLWRGLALHVGFELLLYSSRTSEVNGCDGTDLDLMDRTQRGGVRSSSSRCGPGATSRASSGLIRRPDSTGATTSRWPGTSSSTRALRW